MAFQPIVALESKTVFAYEALVRGHGQQSSASVLGMVEGENVYAFDRACRTKAIQLASGLRLQATSAALSINFIPGAIYRPEVCIRSTLDAATAAHLPLHQILFEVTEGEQVSNPEHLKAIFLEYKRIGFRTAIDDFGAGYAGLNLLAEFQPDIIKMDMALTREIHSRKVSQKVVAAVVSLCSELDIRIIAEGIETAEELNVLRSMGIDLFQGHLFARPALETFPEAVFPPGGETPAPSAVVAHH